MQKYGKTLTYDRIFPIFCIFAVKINNFMKYFEVEFTLSPYSADASDVLSAMAGEVGFESFEETADGLLGYVQQSLFSEAALQEVIADFPFDGVSIKYEIREAEDRDWNEQWEQEGFQPIVIGDKLVIHDGRHKPEETTPALEIEIDAHLAFGTGTHETTRMICATLLDLNISSLTSDSSPLNVLDCGCGTGILGICALKLGATACTAYDIDEWSVDNTRHNAVINMVDERMTIMHGDATILDSLTEHFNMIMANINRNILLNDMQRMVSVMAPKATLILSGFYKEDCALLESKAQTLGLSMQQSRNDGDWSCLIFVKND